MTGYKPGAHCRLNHITEADRGKLPPELRAELTRVVGEIAGRRLPDVVKKLWAKLAQELVHRLRRVKDE